LPWLPSAAPREEGRRTPVLPAPPPPLSSARSDMCPYYNCSEARRCSLQYHEGKEGANWRLNSGPWATMGRLRGPSSQALGCTMTF
jgi:hypothetical protein